MTRSSPLRIRSTKRGLFYLREDVSTQATLSDSATLGLDLTTGLAGRGLGAGFVRLQRYTGRMLQDDVVQVHLVDPHEPKNESLVLWSLIPSPDGVNHGPDSIPDTLD